MAPMPVQCFRAEMVKAHDLNVYRYLKFLLEHRLSEKVADEQFSELTSRSEKTPIYRKSYVNYSELLQFAKGWGNFASERIIILRILSK